MMKITSRAVLACATATLLAACGGNGDNTGQIIDPLPSRVVAANQATAARAALLGGLSVARIGTVRTGTAVTSAARATVQAVRRAVAAAPAEPCEGGGTRTATFDDPDGSGATSVGDVVTVTFAKCVSGGVTLDGTTVASIDLVRGTSYLEAQFQFQRLAVTTGRVVSTLSGSATVAETDAETATGASTDLLVSIGSSGLVVACASPTYRETLTLGGGYQAHVFVLDDGNATIWLSGAFASSLLPSLGGGFSVQTLSPLALAPASAYPASGQLLVQGSDGGNVRVTAVDATRLRLELNARVAGDDGADSTTMVDWSTLIPQ